MGGGGNRRTIGRRREPVDKPNSVCPPSAEAERRGGSHFSYATYPSRPREGLSGQLSGSTCEHEEPAGYTRSCTGRGFSVLLTRTRAGSLAGPPSLLTTRWSLTPPFHLFLPAPEGTEGCVFSVIRSVHAGCGPHNPRFRSRCREPTRGTLPCGVRTFLPDADASERLPDRPAYASGRPGVGAFTSHS